MKTRLTSVTYLGYTIMDRRFSNAMLPWLLREIRATGIEEKLSIAIEDGCLKAYNGNFEPNIIHRLVDILRASQVPGRPDELFYILLNEKEGLLNCYLFKAGTVNEVTDLFTQMREPSPGASPKGSTGSLANGSVTKNIGFQQNNAELPWISPAISLPGNCNSNLTSESQSLVRSVSNASALTSLCADLSPSDSHFFEVLYIGKVRISQRKVPETLIDDALTKFAQHEAEKIKNQRRHSLLSSTGTSIYSTESTENIADDKETKQNTTPLEPDKQKTIDKVPKKTTEEIDKAFDIFTKERIEQNIHKKSPCDSKSMKNNLGTVEEEKIDIQSIITETASSITEYCRNTIENANKSDSSIDYKVENANKSDSSIGNKENANKSDSNGNKVHFTNDIIKIERPEKYASKNDNFDAKRTSFNNDVIRNADIEKLDNQIANVGNKNDSKIVGANKNDSNIITKTFNNTKSNESSPELKIKTNVLKNEPNIPRNPFTKDNSQEKLSFDEIKSSNTDVSSAKSMPENKPFLRDRSASIGALNLKTPISQLIGEQNRTMLFQVGRSELRLISPDRKQILLHRAFKDVASCVLGRHNKDHFGFVCRETNDSYACYVFKCESDSIATEVVNAIKQAFVAHAELLKKSREKSPNMTCEHCPMLWYHRLCHDIEGMNEKKTHAFILRRIEQLPDDEQDLIITKYQGGTNHMYEVNEHNAFLMMLLRAHCEAKQLRHVHDTAENRSEFLNQYLGGSTIFMKAKRSLSSGFDHLLKRRASKDDGLNINIHKKEQSPLPTTPVEAESNDLLSPEVSRSKSLSPAVWSQENDPPPSPMQTAPVSVEEDETNEKEETPVNSPMMDIFLKVSDSRQTTTETVDNDATWRQAIYEKVVQQPDVQEGELSSKMLLSLPTAPPGKRSKEQLRQLWKMAIDQTILLVRMEKENARLKESEESSAVRRIKLEYTELGLCDAGVTLMWDSLLSTKESSRMAKVDKHMLTQAVIQGVPRMSRGGVWYFLAEQSCLRSPPPDVKGFPHYHTPYRSLLAALTKHQHAILIDLGRTFPKHSYFASALGPGQLALYNILKAYSLLDPDVGYCQGLSFVAGILLLHMDEAEAFILLRHLMFRRGLRKQYLPDMSALQVQLYQLSRLLRDHEPELHAKLESLDISPALYAAPWMLTLFTSQFPLGFVVRVFDLIFLESLDVIFSFSLALLSVHRDGLMLCESCEEAAEYLKHKLPDMSKEIYGRVMKMVYSFDITRQLNEYAVEYAVLREEMPRLAALTEDNRQLMADRSRMGEDLDSAMDAITSYQKTQSKLEAQNKIMEQHLTLLSRYISSHRQDPPLEIKKIINTYGKKLSFSSKITSFMGSHDDKVVSAPNFGVSTPNLFAKISKDDVSNALEKRIIKKSQSVHSGLIANNVKNPLKVLDEKVENNYRRDSIDNKKGFFANSHEQIRQERLFEQQLKHDFDENLKKIDKKQLDFDENFKKVDKKLEFDENLKKIDKKQLDFDENFKKLINKSYIDDVNIFQSRKTMSLNLVKDSSKIDSGFVTPISPDKKDNSSVISHPLSDCDVDIKFETTTLKQIRPVKQLSTASK